MRKAERLFQLINILRARQPVTAQELADELGVSVRSVYRYIDDISVSGIPVYGEPGLGYRLRDTFELRPLTLTPDEFDALLLGAQMVSVSTGTVLPSASRTLLSKVRAALPEQATQPQRRIAAHACCAVERSASAALWDRLQAAIHSRRVVEFAYQALSGDLSQRTVWPLGLFYWGGKWTLGAWCALRRNFRDFRLDRMQDVQTLRQTFEFDDNINLDIYMERQSAAWAARRADTGR